MQEFESISASSYDPSALATKLTAKAAEGWSVVAIVPTGGDVTAFVSREKVARPSRRVPRRRHPSLRPALDTADDETPAPELAPRPKRPTSRWSSRRRSPSPSHPDGQSLLSRRRQLRSQPAFSRPSHRRRRTNQRQHPPTSLCRRRRRRPRLPPRQPTAGSRNPASRNPGCGRRACSAGRVVRRPGRAIRIALLGWQHVDRARVSRRVSSSPIRPSPDALQPRRRGAQRSPITDNDH